MAHFLRTQTDGVWDGPGYITVQPDWIDLDSKVFRAINGDKGGCWTPSSPISIGGSGLTVTPPTIVDYGGSLTTLSGARFKLGATNWPQISATHVGRTRTLMTPCRLRQTGPEKYHWITDQNTGGIQSIACTLWRTFATQLFQPSFVLPIRVHDGGRLVSATITFQVNSLRKIPPVATPRMRVVRCDDIGTITSLKSTGGGADADGYVSFPLPTSGDDWYLNGVVQSFTFVCDQNNVVDVSKYTYYVEIIEEVGDLPTDKVNPPFDGSIVRELKDDVKYIFLPTDSTIVGMVGDYITQAPYIGGPTALPTGLVEGDRVLVVYGHSDYDMTFGKPPPYFPASPLTNFYGTWSAGIYTVQSGLWTRTADAATNENFSNSFLICVPSLNQIWEYTNVANPIGLRSTSDQTPVFQRRNPKGNIYHAVSCSFDSIADMRPQ